MRPLASLLGLQERSKGKSSGGSVPPGRYDRDAAIEDGTTTINPEGL